MPDAYEVKLNYWCVLDTTENFMNDRRRLGYEFVHDIPPHCKPSATGTQCCVGVLFGTCRKCGQEKVFTNDKCSAPAEKPWSAIQWHDNWETYGR